MEPDAITTPAGAIIELRVRPLDVADVRMCEWTDCEYETATHALENYRNPESVQNTLARMSLEEAGELLWKEIVKEQLRNGPHLYRTSYFCLLHAAATLDTGIDNLAFIGDMLDRPDTCIMFRRVSDPHQMRLIFLPMQPIEAALAQLDTDASSDLRLM